MASSSSVWTRPKSSSDDPSKLALLAERVKGAMGKSVYPDAKRLSPQEVGISPLNRLFSVHQVHNTILKSFVKEGHDPSRPQVGICCEVRDPAKRKSLEEYNMSLSQSSPLMPKTEPGVIQYEGLACTHYNVALRLVSNSAYSPNADLAKLKDERPSLAEASSLGHHWVVLPEDLSDSLKKDVSVWRNKDQNENQALTDGELIRMAKEAVGKYLENASPGQALQVPLASITTAACLGTPLKIQQAVMGSFCKFVCQMATERHLPLVNEFLQFWTSCVDPKEIAIPHTYFDALHKCKVLQQHPKLRLHMSMAMYCKEGLSLKTRPTPDAAGFLSAKDMEKLGAPEVTFTVPLATAALDKLYDAYKPLLANSLGVHVVREEVLFAGTMIVRLLFGKSMSTNKVSAPGTLLKCPIVTGKLTQEKLNRLFGWWAKQIDDTYPDLAFSSKAGLTDFLPVAPAPEEDEIFKVPGTRVLTKTPSATVAPEEGGGAAEGKVDAARPSFKKGDVVTFTRRMSLPMPLPDHAEFRKDVREGSDATIVSLADEAHKAKTEIFVQIMHKGTPYDMRAWVPNANLTLAVDDPKKSDAPGAEATPGLAPEIVNADPFGKDVEPLEGWDDLIDSETPAASMFSLKGKAAFVMKLVHDLVPPLVPGTDVQVIHRANAVGAKRTEVWTLRDFASGELIIAPWTHEIKDRLYTTGLSVSLRPPEDSVPGNRVLALDGRNRSHLCHQNIRKHVPGATGNLFWVVQRTNDRAKANLVLDYCHVRSDQFLVTVAGTQHKSKMTKNTLPQVPVLVNKKAVPGQTMLVAMDDPVISRARDEDKKAKDEADKRAKEAEEKAKEEKPTKKPRTS